MTAYQKVKRLIMLNCFDTISESGERRDIMNISITSVRMLTRDKQSEVMVTIYSSQFSIITNRKLASPEKRTKGNSCSPTVRQLDFDFRVYHMNKMNYPISCCVYRHCVFYLRPCDS